jgi:hypothetical protein
LASAAVGLAGAGGGVSWATGFGVSVTGAGVVFDVVAQPVSSAIHAADSNRCFMTALISAMVNCREGKAIS